MTKTALEQPARGLPNLFSVDAPPIIRGESQSKIQGATARADV